MNDQAYDISYILEADLADAGVMPVRADKAPSTPPAVSGASALAAAQEAMARELMQAAETHEAMIQQYLSISSAFPGANAYG